MKKNLTAIFPFLLALIFAFASCAAPNSGVLYTITFDSNGGTAVKSQGVSAGGFVMEPAAPTRDGFTFDGWYAEETLITEWKFDMNKVTSDMTLYAKWTSNDAPDPNPTPTPDPTTQSNVLVVYFSATNTTEGIAKLISEVIGCDIWEIVPSVPYTSADLNYSDYDCRANVEQNNSAARPTFNGTVDISQYDVIFIGYPIWWGGMPKIMFTFFDQYNFDGKTIVPFCTSGGSGISESVSEIRSLEPNATLTGAQRFFLQRDKNDNRRVDKYD